MNEQHENGHTQDARREDRQSALKKRLILMLVTVLFTSLLCALYTREELPSSQGFERTTPELKRTTPEFKRTTPGSKRTTTEWPNSDKEYSSFAFSPAGNLTARGNTTYTASTPARTSVYALEDSSDLPEAVVELSRRLHALNESGCIPALASYVVGSITTILTTATALQSELDALHENEHLPFMMPEAKELARIAVDGQRNELLKNLDTAPLATAPGVCRLGMLQAHVRSCHQGIIRVCKELPKEAVTSQTENRNDWLASIFAPFSDSNKQRNQNTLRESIKAVASLIHRMDEDVSKVLTWGDRFRSWLEELEPKKMTWEDIANYLIAVDKELENMQKIVSDAEKELAHRDDGCGS